MSTLLLASLQSCRSVDTDASCKRTINREPAAIVNVQKKSRRFPDDPTCDIIDV